MNPLKFAALAAIAAMLMVGRPASAEDSVSYKNLLTPLLKTGTDIIGQPIVYPPGTPEITAAIVTIPPGGKTGWHTHEVPLFVHILEGAVTVDYGDKGTRVYRAGESIMEAMNWPHNGVNSGDEPVRILAVYMGSNERTNAASVPAPK
jgi:quercetin dioxygenase-like cupin family protein